MEKQALKNNPRLYFYHEILMSQPKIFNTNQKIVSNIKIGHEIQMT